MPALCKVYYAFILIVSFLYLCFFVEKITPDAPEKFKTSINTNKSTSRVHPS